MPAAFKLNEEELVALLQIEEEENSPWARQPRPRGTLALGSITRFGFTLPLTNVIYAGK